MLVSYVAATSPQILTLSRCCISTVVTIHDRKTMIGLYLGKSSVGSTYGAAGSVIVVIVWVYYSAQIFFFGAEFTHAYAEHELPIAQDASDSVTRSTAA
jgi:uncharacterized BrkB/YihY/UPF0761 family membrane protein